MSNNHFYNNFCGNTFQGGFMPPTFVPPPPLPPPELFVLPAPHLNTFDQDYVKMFESRSSSTITVIAKSRPDSISQVRNKLRELTFSLNDLKRLEKELTEKANVSSEEEWKEAIEEVNRHKRLIGASMSKINPSYLDILRKLITKRTAKRLRQKRLRIEKKRSKEDRIKEREEKSRKIDENLQKIKDAITTAKQEEESKLQADVVLKEVLRKKHNAKKFVSKLVALKKLRHARLNTARGRGGNVSLKEAEEFDAKIDKLKFLWAQKLIAYEKEEEDLNAKLKQDCVMEIPEVNKLENQIASNLKKWRTMLFGASTASPQVNFDGDVARFVGVRRQWDQYANESGSSLPVGWVMPSVSNK